MLLRRVLGLGRRAREPERGLVLAFRPRHPGRGGPALNLDLLGPVGILQGVPERRELLDVCARLRGLTAASRSDRAREVDHGLGVGEAIRPRLDGRGLRPASALHGPARLDGGHGEVRGGPPRVVLLGREVAHEAARLVDDALGVTILGLLEIRVDEVVERMHAVIGIAAGLLRRRGGDVALDGLGPHAEEHVGVRRHVERMRHRGGELRVAPRRGQPPLREGGVVVSVDDVVRGAGVIRLHGEDLLGDLRGSLLLGVGAVVRIGGGLEGEGVEGLRLPILRIAGEHQLHRLLVGGGARAVVEAIRILEEGVRGRDVVSLARRGVSDRLGLLHRFDPSLERGGARRRPDLVPLAHGDAPVGDGTVRVGLGHGREGLRRLQVPEGVQDRHRLVEGLLHRRLARDREAHLSDPVRRVDPLL